MSKAIKSGLKKCKELLAAKDYEGVLRETNGILSAEPVNYSALIFRGKALYERQDYVKAEKDFRAAVDSEPEKPLGFQGLLSVYERLKQYDQYIGIATRLLPMLPVDRTEKLIMEVLDICRYNEYYAEWGRFIVMLSNETKRKETIERQYGNIPFSALDQAGLIDQIEIDATTKKTVLAIWRNVQPDLSSPFNQAVYALEKNGTRSEQCSTCLAAEITSLLDATERPAREVIVAARQLLQKFEKFDFIMAKKNLKADDIDEQFKFAFDSGAAKRTLKWFILEETLYRAEVPDLTLAAELIGQVECPLFRVKLALMQNEKIEVELLDQVKMPVLFDSAKYDELMAQRILHVQVEMAINDQNNALAGELLAKCSESAETFYLQGRHAILIDELKSATKSLLKAAKLSPSNWRYFYWLGKVYIGLGDSERGVKCVIKSISLNQRADNIELACQYVEPERALALLKSFRDTQLVIGVESETQLPQWYQFRYGLSLLELGATDEAIKTFQRLTRKSQTSPVMWECLAEAYVQRGSLKTALKAYHYTAELYESNNDLDRLNKIKFRIGQLYLDTLEVDLAMDMFNSVEVKSAEILIGLAQAHYERAKVYAERWLPEICYGQIEETLRLCFNAFSSGIAYNSPLVWKLVGDAFMLVRLFNKTKLKLTVPVELSQDKLDRLACFKMAQMAYYNVIKGQPNAIAWSDLSLVYFCLDQSDHAIQCAKRAIELIHDESKVVRSDLWHNLALVAFSTNPALAQHACVSALDLNQENARVWTLLGLLYIKIGEAKLSWQALVRAQAADTESAHAWAGLAHLAAVEENQEATDLYRHAAELINVDAAQGHAYHIASNMETGTEQWHMRNIVETNGLITAASNVIRLTNVKELNDKEKLVAGFLAEKVGLNRTAVEFWGAMEMKTKVSTVMMANALAKLNETDEALEIIAEFEEDTDADVVRTIGFILSKAGLHEFALAHYQKHISEDNNELLCLAGVSALRSGDIDQATVYLMTCAGSLSKYRLKSIKTLAAIGHLTEDVELLTKTLKLLRTDDEPELRLELTVRLGLIEGDIHGAVRKCQHAIRAHPTNLHARLLLSAILLKHDPTNNALVNLLPPDLPAKHAPLFAHAQLTAKGKQRQMDCARRIQQQYHRQPWCKQLRAAFVASLDLLRSARGMSVFDHVKTDRLDHVQHFYLNGLLSGAETDGERVWSIATLTRLGGDHIEQCLQLLEDVDEEHHTILLATLTTLTEPVKLGDVELTVESVVDLLEAKQVPLPYWLPSLLGALCVRSNQPQLALRCYLLLVRGIGSTRAQSLHVVQEAIKLIELKKEKDEDITEWVDLGHNVVKQLLEANPLCHIANMMQAILYVYGGDYKRGTRQLARMLNKPNCCGLWRSCARFHLAKFMKAAGDKKLEHLFDTHDKYDHLFEFTKTATVL